MMKVKPGGKIPLTYYEQTDVVALARDLLGKMLCTRIDDRLTAGMITETEAYAGVTDKASHAYGGRYTTRTRIMFERGGTAYIYLCYGVHSLFNIVTNTAGVPNAILIRGVFPAEGLEVMMQRAGSWQRPAKAGSGPGRVSRILGMHYSLTGTMLDSDLIWLEDHSLSIPDSAVVTGPRIGVDYAAEDALLPYRFLITDPEQFMLK